MTTLLELDDVAVAYGDDQVVHDVSLRLEAGHIGCLLGPSGCGKTSLLRAIAGFEPLVRGRISLQGEEVSRSGFMLAPEARRVGMVFQDLALFPHLTVVDNVAFGLRSLPPAARRERADRLLDMVGLADYARQYPHQLSGGQQQRIALARALAPRPQLLLLDEPFSGLDLELREELAGQVRGVIKREGITAMLVTHDQHEAFAMADEIGVMRAGRLHQWGRGSSLYRRPADAFVAKFIGEGVMLSGRVRSERSVSTELGVIEIEVPADQAPGDRVEVLIRPDAVLLDPDSAIQAEVTDRVFRGGFFLYKLRLPSGQRLLHMGPVDVTYPSGTPLRIRIAIDRPLMFPAEDSREAKR
jgi:iron(III) transport system ATP-binding protein